MRTCRRCRTCANRRAQTKNSRKWISMTACAVIDTSFRRIAHHYFRAFQGNVAYGDGKIHPQAIRHNKVKDSSTP